MTGRRQKLAAAIDDALAQWCSTPFAWGSSDCLLSLADIIAVARGYDPAAPFRGRYSTLRGAVRVTRSHGSFAGALEAMAAEHGWPEIARADAAIGDIGIVEIGSDGPRCGMIRYHRNWIGRGLRGFTSVPTACVSRAWRVI